MKKIAIFASGGGSNAESIIKYFNGHSTIEVALIVSNKENAYVLERAKNHNIPHLYLSNPDFKSGETVHEKLIEFEIDCIILAGFLLLIPKVLTLNYPNRIINIHPALLPKYGGKGMYGKFVHQAVFDNFEKESGLTIHLVNEKYDEGKVLFQAKVELEVTDTPDIIASKVLKLEHKHYSKVIDEYLLNLNSI